MSEASPRFRSVVLDVDSTLSGIEGIDWLAARRGIEVAARVALQTERAMTGELALETVYRERLEAVRPDARDIEALGEAYVANIAPGAREAVQAWRARGIRVEMVSGGIKAALLPLASHLGLDAATVNAVDVYHDADGAYSGYATSPLSVATGKRDVVAALRLPSPILAVGDGSTDLEMKEVVDSFAAFTGFVTRGHVIANADLVVATFAELRDIVGV